MIQRAEREIESGGTKKLKILKKTQQNLHPAKENELDKKNTTHKI